MVQPRPTRRAALAPPRALRPACGRPTAVSISSTNINIMRRAAPRNVMNIADELQEAYVLDMPKFNDVTFGGVALGAALTPQKRGLPPPRTGRGRRLPSWTAALGRPKILLWIPFSTYMQILDTRWAILRKLAGKRTTYLAVGVPQRARARAMVRLVMVRLGMAANGRSSDASPRAAASRSSQRSAATGRSSCSACEASLDVRPYAAARLHFIITNDSHASTTDHATASDTIGITASAWVKILPKVGWSCPAERRKAGLETRGRQRAKLAPAAATSGRVPNSWRG